jgi:hypothetical protein
MFTLLIKIMVRFNINKNIYRYSKEPIYDYLYHEGVATWVPVLKRKINDNLFWDIKWYSGRVIELTFAGASPDDFENIEGNGLNISADKIKKDPQLEKQLNKMDLSGETRKTLLYEYLVNSRS